MTHEAKIFHYDIVTVVIPVTTAIATDTMRKTTTTRIITTMRMTRPTTYLPVTLIPWKGVVRREEEA